MAGYSACAAMTLMGFVEGPPDNVVLGARRSGRLAALALLAVGPSLVVGETLAAPWPARDAAYVFALDLWLVAATALERW